MAVKSFMSPSTSIGEFVSVGTVVESAASIAVFFVLVWFAVFLRGLWGPKASPSTSHATNSQRLQHSSGVHKAKKGNRTKKGKKTRGPPQSKFDHGMEAISEEEMEDVKLQSSSDLEAPSMASPTLSCESAPEAVSEEISSDIEAPSLPPAEIFAEEAILQMCSKSLESWKKPLTASSEKAVHSGTEVEATTRCPEASSQLLASEDRVYTSSLLLMHREVAVRIARGAPGLDHPPTDFSSTDLKWLCVR